MKPIAVNSAPSPRADVRSDAPVAIRVFELTRRFGPKVAVDQVGMTVHAGEIHALLGPNGAGKTTLLKILTGFVQPDAGELQVMGRSFRDLSHRRSRKLLGLVPSGDRSFYLRLSGLENLAFFGRLHGLTRREAVARAQLLLDDVGLTDAAGRRVGNYSHGMQKRLSLARALLMEPPVLLVDEATHDLDPEAARQAQDMVAAVAKRGAAVLWTTQRVDEIRGFADTVTVLDQGRVQFQGTVSQLIDITGSRRYLLRLRGCEAGSGMIEDQACAALRGVGLVTRPNSSDRSEYVLHLLDDVILGEAISRLTAAGVQVLACRAERSEIEAAFLHVVREARNE